MEAEGRPGVGVWENTERWKEGRGWKIQKKTQALNQWFHTASLACRFAHVWLQV